MSVLWLICTLALGHIPRIRSRIYAVEKAESPHQFPTFTQYGGFPYPGFGGMQQPGFGGMSGMQPGFGGMSGMDPSVMAGADNMQDVFQMQNVIQAMSSMAEAYFASKADNPVSTFSPLPRTPPTMADLFRKYPELATIDDCMGQSDLTDCMTEFQLMLNNGDIHPPPGTLGYNPDVMMRNKRGTQYRSRKQGFPAYGFNPGAYQGYYNVPGAMNPMMFAMDGMDDFLKTYPYMMASQGRTPQGLDPLIWSQADSLKDIVSGNSIIQAMNSMGDAYFASKSDEEDLPPGQTTASPIMSTPATMASLFVKFPELAMQDDCLQTDLTDCMQTFQEMLNAGQIHPNMGRGRRALQFEQEIAAGDLMKYAALEEMETQGINVVDSSQLYKGEMADIQGEAQAGMMGDWLDEKLAELQALKMMESQPEFDPFLANEALDGDYLKLKAMQQFIDLGYGVSAAAKYADKDRVQYKILESLERPGVPSELITKEVVDGEYLKYKAEQLLIKKGYSMQLAHEMADEDGQIRYQALAELIRNRVINEQKLATVLEDDYVQAKLINDGMSQDLAADVSATGSFPEASDPMLNQKFEDVAEYIINEAETKPARHQANPNSGISYPFWPKVAEDAWKNQNSEISYPFWPKVAEDAWKNQNMGTQNTDPAMMYAFGGDDFAKYQAMKNMEASGIHTEDMYDGDYLQWKAFMDARKPKRGKAKNWAEDMQKMMACKQLMSGGMMMHPMGFAMMDNFDVDHQDCMEYLAMSGMMGMNGMPMGPGMPPMSAGGMQMQPQMPAGGIMPMQPQMPATQRGKPKNWAEDMQKVMACKQLMSGGMMHPMGFAMMDNFDVDPQNCMEYMAMSGMMGMGPGHPMPVPGRMPMGPGMPMQPQMPMNGMQMRPSMPVGPRAKRGNLHHILFPTAVHATAQQPAFLPFGIDAWVMEEIANEQMMEAQLAKYYLQQGISPLTLDILHDMNDAPIPDHYEDMWAMHMLQKQKEFEAIMQAAAASKATDTAATDGTTADATPATDSTAADATESTPETN